MTKVLGDNTRFALWFSPVILVVIGFICAVRWLRPDHPTVTVLSIGMALFVMGYSSWVARRHQRRLDEVQIAHQRYANSLGWVWGAVVTVLLLMLPPVMNRLIDLVSAMVGVPDIRTPALTQRLAVQLAFFGGICLLMLMQALGVIVAAVVWERRMAAP